MTYTLLASAWAPGPVALLLLTGLLLAVPTATELPRRVAVNVAVLIGWVPLVWWLRWPTFVDRSALLVALGWGALAAAVAWAPDSRKALTRLRPAMKPMDVTIPIGGSLALAAMTRWAFASTPRQALTVLLPGVDNCPHFNMFAGIRTYGAMLSAVGHAPDGSRWAFYNYPQGFHALAATLSELMAPQVGTGPEMLRSYTQSVALIVCLGVVMTTSAILAVPGLRTRPVFVVPAVVIPWAALLWEPGQKVIVDGFANFWLGAAAAGTALLVGAAAREFLPRPEVLAVGGLFVACAYAWAPLLLFAIPALLALLVGRGAARESVTYRSRLVWAASVAAVSGAAILWVVLLLLRTVPVYSVAIATGGLHGTSPTPTLVLVVVAIYSCLSYPVWLRRSSTPDLPDSGRIRVLVLAPVLGFLVLSAFLVAQLALIGTTAYYFLKYMTGFELVLAALAPAVCAAALAACVPRLRGRAAVAASALTGVLATQFFGWFPHGTMPLFSTTYGTVDLGAPLSVSGVADGVLKAAQGSRESTTINVEYFPLGRASAPNPFYGDAWFHAVQHTVSEKVFARWAVWRERSEDLDSAASLIALVLEREPAVRVVVDPTYVQPLRHRIHSPELARRVTGWG